MKSIFLMLGIWFFLTLSANAQCVDDANNLCVPRTVVDASVAAANELKQARATIAAFQAERTATEAERSSAQRLIDRLNNVIALQDRMSAEYEKALAMFKQVLNEAFALIERQAKMLSKPPSAWSKFLDTLKTVVTLTAGIALGRGF